MTQSNKRQWRSENWFSLLSFRKIKWTRALFVGDGWGEECVKLMWWFAAYPLNWNAVVAASLIRALHVKQLLKSADELLWLHCSKASGPNRPHSKRTKPKKSNTYHNIGYYLYYIIIWVVWRRRSCTINASCLHSDIDLDTRRRWWESATDKQSQNDDSNQRLA